MIYENNELRLGRVQRLFLKVDLRNQTVTPFASCRNKQLIRQALIAATAFYLQPVQSALVSTSTRVHQIMANVQKSFRNNTRGTGILGLFCHPMDDGLGPQGLIETYFVKHQTSGTVAPIVPAQQANTNVINTAYSTHVWGTGATTLTNLNCAKYVIIEIVYRDGASL